MKITTIVKICDEKGGRTSVAGTVISVARSKVDPLNGLSINIVASPSFTAYRLATCNKNKF